MFFLSGTTMGLTEQFTEKKTKTREVENKHPGNVITKQHTRADYLYDNH